MAHVSIIDTTNTVIDVIVINNDSLPNDGNFSEETEIFAENFIKNLGLLPNNHKALLTSYNGKFRYNYGSIGSKFLEDVGVDGAFILPQPFPSWSLDNNFNWQPPEPQSGPGYYWEESSQQWKNIE